MSMPFLLLVCFIHAACYAPAQVIAAVSVVNAAQWLRLFTQVCCRAGPRLHRSVFFIGMPDEEAKQGNRKAAR